MRGKGEKRVTSEGKGGEKKRGQGRNEGICEGKVMGK